jgi:hypothetical protein
MISFRKSSPVAGKIPEAINIPMALRLLMPGNSDNRNRRPTYLPSGHLLRESCFPVKHKGGSFKYILPSNIQRSGVIDTGSNNGIVVWF